ncbi:MAG: muramoyltetrapeptide carboxypeptidase [Paucimonas sp.]|nr:muramoyltetrapeptide carboxypeptidase [Paucimonas sp.]
MNETPIEVPSGVSVAIVAPGGYVEDPVAYERGLTRLEALGCRTKSFYEPEGKFQRFGGSDDTRLAQLHDAASDADTKIILALRGGYGTTRLLDWIDYELLASSGKLLVGHSDLTALQLALLAKTGAASFSGPMLWPDFGREDVSDFTHYHFWRCLMQRTHTVFAQYEDNPSISASGMLWGGNLAMLTHLLGSEYFPKVEKGILFLEDISEHPYRVERMMIQLMRAGVIDRQSAVVLGDFSGYQLNAYDNGYDFNAMLTYLRAQTATPILAGLPYGHIRDKATLVIGSQAEVMSMDGRFHLTMSAYPSL